MSTKSSYQISAQTIESLLIALNRHLASIADRLDKLEGIRGDFESDSGGTFSGSVNVTALNVSVDSEKLHSME